MWMQTPNWKVERGKKFDVSGTPLESFFGLNSTYSIWRSFERREGGRSSQSIKWFQLSAWILPNFDAKLFLPSIRWFENILVNGLVDVRYPPYPPIEILKAKRGLISHLMEMRQCAKTFLWLIHRCVTFRSIWCTRNDDPFSIRIIRCQSSGN